MSSVKVAIENGIKRSTYHNRIRLGWDKKTAATKQARYTGDYAVYRKGELVVIGTREECAKELGVSQEYIHWMTTQTGIKRRNNRKNPEMAMAAVKLDDEDF